MQNKINFLFIESGALSEQPRPVNAKENRHFVTALFRSLDVSSAFHIDDRMSINGNSRTTAICQGQLFPGWPTRLHN